MMTTILKSNIIKWSKDSFEASSVEFDGANLSIVHFTSKKIPGFKEILSSHHHTIETLYQTADKEEYSSALESCWKSVSPFLPDFIVSPSDEIAALLISYENNSSYHHLMNTKSDYCIYNRYTNVSIFRNNDIVPALKKVYSSHPFYRESFTTKTFFDDGTSSRLKAAFAIGNYNSIFSKSNYAEMSGSFIDEIKEHIPEAHRIILCSEHPGCIDFTYDNFINVLNDNDVRLLYIFIHNPPLQPNLDDESFPEGLLLNELIKEMPLNEMNKYLAPSAKENFFESRINFNNIRKEVKREIPLSVEAYGCFEISVSMDFLEEYNDNNYSMVDSLRDSNCLITSYGFGLVPVSIFYVMQNRFRDFFKK